MKTKITVDIEAKKIDMNHIFVECPFCKKSVHSIKPKIHLHGSNHNIDNRIEHRVGHCNREESIIFKIHITDFTERV